MKKLKATRAMLASLRQTLDYGPLSLGRSTLTMKHLQAVLDHQGYFAGLRYRFYPEFSDQGKFTGWRITQRQIGPSAN